MNLKKKIQSIEAEDFVNSHPALNTMLNGNTITIMRFPVCKNEHGEPSNVDNSIKVWNDDPDYKKWRDSKYFDPEDICDWDPDPAVEVPYAEYYGYEWKPVKVIYLAEITWVIFTGDHPEDLIASHKDYSSFAGDDIRGFETYEDTWIAVADWVRKNLGDFNSYDFHTEEEKRSHREEDLFLRTEKDDRGFYPVERNPLWKSCTDAELNNRWFKWFITTDYFKKHWAETFEDEKGFYHKFYKRITSEVK